MAQESLAARDRPTADLVRPPEESSQALACLQEAAARCQSKALACWLSITKLVSPLPPEQLAVLLLELNAPGTGLVPTLRRFMQCCSQVSAGEWYSGSALLNAGGC